MSNYVKPDCSLARNWVQAVGPNTILGDSQPPTIPVTVANGVVYYSSNEDGLIYAFDTSDESWQKAVKRAAIEFAGEIQRVVG